MNAPSLREGVKFNQTVRAQVVSAGAVLLLSVAAIVVRADQIEMQNGDRYIGNVLSLNTNTLTLQSDVLGTLHLPRAKVAHISLGSALIKALVDLPTQTNLLLRAAGAHVSKTNSAPDMSAALRQLGADKGSLQQVQSQLLSDAGPEANKKFNEMVGGLLTGRMTVNDLRAEAKSLTEQVRALKRDLGDDAGGMIDTYLVVLDTFLKETEPAGGTTNTAAAKR
jgi:hypothetical protein